MANFLDEKYGIKKLLDFEGGICRDEADSASQFGWTAFGVTERDDKEVKWDIFHQYLNETSDKKEFGQTYKKCLSNQEFMSSVYETYKKAYWDKIKGDDIISQRIAYNIFDFAVNAGVGKASKIAQEIVGVSVDGVFGPATVKAINSYNEENFIAQYKNRREGFYRELVAKKPQNQVFLKGWLKRVGAC